MSRNVLILDDDPSIGRFIARVCTDNGFHPLVASSFVEFKQHLGVDELFLVITDLQMPDCDGIECMRMMSSVQADTPVAILSGFDPRVLQTAESFGRSVGLRVVSTLQKPIVVSAIRELLETVAGDVEVAPEDELAAAIENDEFMLYYQPKVSFRQENFGAVVGFEGLARWQHPQRGLVAPDDFIPLAEQSKLITPLTERLMRSGLRQLRRWSDEGHDFSLSVNVAPQMLDDRMLADSVARLVQEAGVEPNRLTLEITETGAMADPTKTMETLTRLRLKGFKLSIDDFGTGFSSLVQLYQLPFSELKIDKSFVLDIDERDDAQVIVKTLIDLAHNLSLRVCAEGVETMYEWSRLIEYGCDRIQGYYVGRPMPAGEIAAWLDDWHRRRREIELFHTQTVRAWKG